MDLIGLWGIASGVGIFFAWIPLFKWIEGSVIMTIGYHRREATGWLYAFYGLDEKTDNDPRIPWEDGRRSHKQSIGVVMVMEVLVHLLHIYDYENNSTADYFINESSFPLFFFLTWYVGKRLIDRYVYSRYTKMDENYLATGGYTRQEDNS